MGQLNKTVTGRVMYISSKRMHPNREGVENYFCFDITDHSASIRVVASGKICDAFYQIGGGGEEDIIMPRINGLYYLTGCRIETAATKYTSSDPYAPTNALCIKLTANSKIKICTIKSLLEMGMSIPPERVFRYDPFRDLPSKPIGAVVDIIGLVVMVGIVVPDKSREITSVFLYGRPQMQQIILLDNTGALLNVILRYDFPGDISDSMKGQPVALIGAEITNVYQALTIFTTRSTIMLHDLTGQPSVTQPLLEWYSGLEYKGISSFEILYHNPTNNQSSNTTTGRDASMQTLPGLEYFAKKS